ncbi:MAG: PAS domain-containing protein [Deltaproteobacteria bacterium]|nr:PAS domain-containing protein [Deltaproteobacteria bacterium]
MAFPRNTDHSPQRALSPATSHEAEIKDIVRAAEAFPSPSLALTLRCIGDGLVTADTNGTIVLMSKVSESLTGFTQDEAVGKPLAEVFCVINEKTRKPAENPIEKVLAAGKIIELPDDMLLIDRNGTERVIAGSAAPIIDKENTCIGVVLVFRDITEKLNMEHEIIRAQKFESIGVLTGGFAHDFNNILTAIAGNITLAKMYLNPGEKAYEKLTQAEKASQRAIDLIRQMRTFSRGEPPVRKTASINKLIEASIVSSLTGSTARCVNSVPDDLWPVKVDEGQINQMFNNLLINADQAMKNGGKIVISAENITVGEETSLSLKKGKHVKITVKDQGIGIPKENLSKIFDPYFTTKENRKGLGISTAYSIIKNHEGDISVESRVGVGTTFSVYLPATQKKQCAKRSGVNLPVGGNGKILIMDDEK